MGLSGGLGCHGLAFCWQGRQATRKPVLESVDVVFAPGEIALVAGDTGSGKSTLLHLLAGLLHPTNGEIRADGQSVSRWLARHRDRWRRQVGIVFQHLALIPDISVAENLLLPLIPRKIPWAEMQARIRRQLIEVDLDALAHRPARELSSGQRQRIAVARALIGNPRFILADEPTAFQDDGHARKMVDHLKVHAEEGSVVIVCTQDPRIKASSAIQRSYRLESGALFPEDRP